MLEQALNDYEFYTIGSKTESKTFSIPSESDDVDSSIDEKLKFASSSLAKIITIAISVIALILTFFLISSIDSDSSPDNVSTILNEKSPLKS